MTCMRKRCYFRFLGVIFIFVLMLPAAWAGGDELEGQPEARQWLQHLLWAIEIDLATPTIHARNLHHLSTAMWDAWAAYDPHADGFFYNEELATAEDLPAARAEAISYAAFRLLWHRFEGKPEESPGWPVTEQVLLARMNSLGYDPDFEDTTGDSPAALGNRIAAHIIDFGLSDGSNEGNGYESTYYEPINPPLDPEVFGNPDMVYPNHWQPLEMEIWCDQLGSCHELDEPVGFLSPEWGHVTPFALDTQDLDIYPGPGDNTWPVYLDPGPPPLFGSDSDEDFREGFMEVLRKSATLDPDDGEIIDISPASIGNSSLGDNDGKGYDVNPVTGAPYEEQLVPRGDYTRVLAEFWADGPASETPPGHWYSILHYVADHEEFEKRWEGVGEILEDQEWYVKAYLALGGAAHDAAIAAWSAKGYYDYVRPILAIRYMAEKGQSSDPDGPSYDPDGLPLEEGLVEVITEASSAPGERHEHLGDHVGKIAVYSWAGHVEEPGLEYAGVDWILGGYWWPYQLPLFVTPPFAGYVSGHSTFSRAAAETLGLITGSEYFPGGLGEFEIEQYGFLEFEVGPSQDLTLQWASYADAADQCSLSRIYGGIHPPADDIPGRLMGYEIGHKAFERASRFIVGDRIFSDRFANK